MCVLRTRTPSRLSSFLYEPISVIIIIMRSMIFILISVFINSIQNLYVSYQKHYYYYCRYHYDHQCSPGLILLSAPPRLSSLPLSFGVWPGWSTCSMMTPRLSATLQVPGRMFVHHLSATRWHCFLASFQTLRCPTLTFKTYVFIAWSTISAPYLSVLISPHESLFL